MERYKINIAQSQIIISAAFEKAMQNPKSEEYKLIKSLYKDIPLLTVSKRTHKSPSGTNKFKNLSYANMERFMKILPNNKEYLEEYSQVRELADTSQKSPYAYVRNWFLKKFPEYHSNPMFYINNIAPVVELSGDDEEFEAIAA